MWKLLYIKSKAKEYSKDIQLCKIKYTRRTSIFRPINNKKPSNIKSISKTNWVVIIDKYTGLKFSNFYQAKNGIVEPTYVKLQTFKNMNREVKYIRYDNTHENKLLDKRSNSTN